MKINVTEQDVLFKLFALAMEERNRRIDVLKYKQRIEHVSEEPNRKKNIPRLCDTFSAQNPQHLRAYSGN